MLHIFKQNEAAERLRLMRARAAKANAAISESAAKIIEDVRERGWEAVCEYSEKFDHATPAEITRDRLKAAYDAIPTDLRGALEHSAKNIREYHLQSVPQSWMWQKDADRKLGQVVRGLDRVGIYVPGGTAAYPSSVLMLAIPARCAGVREIIMVTPPTENLNDAVLAAAYIAGVDRVIGLGGVQAVAALSFGAGFVPRVDKIVGPGNAYVAAAKRQLYGTVDIDMVAGPSEILVLADETADPAFIAADLLGQAEHDRLASAILVTTSAELAEKTAAALAAEQAELPRGEIAGEAVENYGAAIVCGKLEEAAALANEIAPEHLEIMMKDAESVLPMIRNAGAVFVGAFAPEPLGDYLAGPSHVLPTSGSARFFSPIGVDSFLKRMSVIRYSEKALREDAGDITTVAYAEGLHAHARAVEVRVR